MKPAPVRRAPGKAAGLAGGKQVAAPDTSAAGVKAAIAVSIVRTGEPE
jgi:hypothetical protein